MGSPTAGPWEAKKWVCHAATTIMSGDTVVAECSGHGRLCADSVADAKLIAAAPDLYAALKAVLGFFDSGEFVRDTTHDFEQGWHLKMIPVVKSLSDANAALNKAEGKTLNA